MVFIIDKTFWFIRTTRTVYGESYAEDSPWIYSYDHAGCRRLQQATLASPAELSNLWNWNEIDSEESVRQGLWNGPAHCLIHREGTQLPVPLKDWRTRGATPRPLPTHVSRQSDCSLSTTFPLIRLFFTGAVLIKGPLSTQNICSEVLLWLLMMPGIIKSGRNFHFAWSFLSAPCPSSPLFCSHLNFHPFTILPWCGYPPGNWPRKPVCLDQNSGYNVPR